MYQYKEGNDEVGFEWKDKVEKNLLHQVQGEYIETQKNQ